MLHDQRGLSVGLLVCSLPLPGVSLAIESWLPFAPGAKELPCVEFTYVTGNVQRTEHACYSSTVPHPTVWGVTVSLTPYCCNVFPSLELLGASSCLIDP